jgi:predicted ester cyclase
MPEQLGKDTVDRIIDLVVTGFNERDHQRIEEAVADHLLDRSKFLGSLDFRERLQLALSVLPDARLEVDEYMIHGNMFAAKWTISGTHEGEFMGFAGTGKKVAVRGLSVDLVKEGKVTEHWAFPDLPGLLADIQG